MTDLTTSYLHRSEGKAFVHIADEEGYVHRLKSANLSWDKRRGLKNVC